jgi:hypothetical protein
MFNRNSNGNMRFLILILASLFAFGMPEVRAQESVEESIEVVLNHAQGQTVAAKRTFRPAHVRPFPAAGPTQAFVANPGYVGQVTESLFIEFRVLRL